MGERSLIEWKLIVKVTVDNGEPDHSVGISLRFGSLKRRSGGNSRGWRIECLDYDAGRIYEQHRLISDFVTSHKYKHSYCDIINKVTTKLTIVPSQSEQNEHQQQHHHSHHGNQRTQARSHGHSAMSIDTNHHNHPRNGGQSVT